MGRILTITILIVVFGIFIAISDSLASADQGEYKVTSRLGDRLINTTADASTALSNTGMDESIENIIYSVRDSIGTILTGIY